MHPIQIIIGGLSSLVTFGFIALDIFLFREWYKFKDSTVYEDYAQRCLLFAILVVVVLVIGKFLMKFFLGKRGTDDPKFERSEENLSLTRPEGNTLHVEFYGPKDAQPIILIHGWSSDSTQWYYFKRHFSKTYRLIVYDLPGLGFSSKVKNQDYSLEKFARDLDKVIELAGDKKPIIMGHSIGGMTILTYMKVLSERVKDKVSGIVLIQTTYTNPVRTAIFSNLLTKIEKPLLIPIAKMMIALSPVLQIINWIKYLNGSQHFNNHITGFAGTETRGQLGHVTLLSTKAPVDVVARGCLSMFEYDATETLRSIRIPTLIIAGNKDILTKKEASQYMASKIKTSELVILSPSGHMGPMERNAEMITAIDAWTRKITTEQASQPVELYS